MDDTYLVVASESYETNCAHIAEYSKEITAWADHNGVRFEPEKNKVMHFRMSDPRPNSRESLPDIGQPVCAVRKLKILGLTVDNQLKWKHHVAEVNMAKDPSLHMLAEIFF